MLEIALINSYVAYKVIIEPISVLEYKRRVTQSLLTLSRPEPKKKERPIDIMTHYNLETIRGERTLENKVSLQNTDLVKHR